MKMWFEHYAEEIAWAAEHGQKAAQLPAKRTITPVSPLLKSKWGQDSPFNDKCPIDKTDNTRSATGCVATAVAQIMYYHKHPTQGVGEHTNNWDNRGAYSNYKGKGYGSEYANFGATTYDWANMKNSYSGSATTAQKEAVATLMYHVGIACDMTYGGDAVGGSGAYTYVAAQALYTYFKYDKSLKYIMMNYLGLSKFEQAFIDELNAGRPILMGGATKHNEGHEFVCDGVNADGLFHINWGWNGTSDNYFALSALDPDEQGIGGASSLSGFRVQVEAVIGIKPDAGGTYSAPIVDVELYQGKHYYSFSKTEASKTETIKFSTKYAYNYGPADVSNAPVCFGVYTKDSVLVDVFGSDKFSMTAGGNNYSSLNVKASFNGLAAGKYLLALVFRLNDTQEWTPIGFEKQGVFRPFKVTDNTISIGEPESRITIVEGDFDVNTAEFYFYGNKQWELAMYNAYTGEPVVAVTFTSGANNKVAGEYNLTTNAAVYSDYETWYNYGSASITSKSGTMTIVRREDDVYEIWLSFKGKDNKNYELHGLFYDILAMNQYGYDVTLQDPIVEILPTTVEVVTTDKPEVIKTIENGHIVIKLGEKNYNILGSQL